VDAGTPAYRRLLDLARRHRTTLIVLTSHGRTADEAVPLGAATERLVTTAPCPVLVVPAGRARPE